MESRAKLLGHSAHQILIVFPLGLLATAVVFDIVHLITRNDTFSVVAYWMLASGLIVGESLFGVVNAGIVSAAQTGLLAGLGIGKSDPRAEAPLAPPATAGWIDTDAALWATLGVFILVLGFLYLWTAAQGKKAAKAG